MEQREEGEGEGRREGKEEEGDAPLLKSRDPHLAGGQKWKMYESTRKNCRSCLRTYVFMVDRPYLLFSPFFVVAE